MLPAEPSLVKFRFIEPLRTCCRTPLSTRIGHDCEIVNKEGVEESIKEEQGFYIRSGIVTVLKGATIKPHTVI